MFKSLVFAMLVLLSNFSFAQDETCTMQLRVEGVIGPGVLDYLERGIKKTKEEKCASVLLLINTPGGQLQTTREIVEVILNSQIPILCLVAPPGGHAGSAGAIILQACHVSGAMEATNIGAATPVSGMGEQIGEDLRKKLLNDTISWLEGITKLRERNLEFSRKIVSEAKAVDAKEALKEGAIDVVVNKVDEFIKFSEGRKVKMTEGLEVVVKTGAVKFYNPDSRFKVLQIFSDPQIAYLMFMGSLALLYFELTHPGAIVPGVVGGIGLILSMINFHTLEVQWAGLLLMVLGIVFLIAEAFVPSFGALGIGGLISFVLGGLFLFDAEQTGLSLPISTILVTAIGLGIVMLTFGYMAMKAQVRKIQTGKEELIGKIGEVKRLNEDRKSGKLFVMGELWSFESNQEINLSDKVLINEMKGLILIVSPVRS